MNNMRLGIFDKCPNGKREIAGKELWLLKNPKLVAGRFNGLVYWVETAIFCMTPF